MKIVSDIEFGGERPLFATHDLTLENVTIHAGESALKCCSEITANNCRFEGKYPFWHTNGFRINDCVFTPGARAALWYSTNLVMTNTLVEAPKMFREMTKLALTNVRIPDAQETLWHCHDVTLHDVEVKNADYLLMHSSDIKISDYRQQGNYSFQYCKSVEIRNARIDSKDAFWNSEDVTIYDSELEGEYLGWHSKNLKLVRCKISGTQPLCYCHNLVMEDCIFGDDANLAFEDSEVNATIKSNIVSVKNPRTGSINALAIGEVIIDNNILAPGDCKIKTEI
ncbi:MAG: DUF3737 family protein [Duncaniella sp.]|nr:DUF3737 family protein [Muribaculum sp.]MCM1256053.1 DUF3737 family protein [Duncaniella sp.]